MNRGTHRAVALACVVAVCCCWTLPSAAQVAALAWSAPRGCPDTAYVTQHLAELARAERSRRDLKVRARVQRLGSPARSRAKQEPRASTRPRYVLRLVLRASDYHAERRLESTSCTSVADAAIWLIAVALDPSLSAGAVAAAPADAAPPTAGATAPATVASTPSFATQAAPAPNAADASRSSATEPRAGAQDARASTPPDSTRSAPEAPRASSSPRTGAPHESAPPAPERAAADTYATGRAPWRVDWAGLPRWWRAGVFGGVWSASLPAPQASVGARLGYGINLFYAELRGAAELPRARRLSDATEPRFATQDLGLALCAQWGGRLRGGPCATAAVLRTTGGARGAPEARDRALPWSAAGMSIELGFRAFAGLEIMFETGAQLPISARPRFTVDGVGEVAVAAPVNVYARVGLGFRSTDVAREQ